MTRSRFALAFGAAVLLITATPNAASAQVSRWAAKNNMVGVTVQRHPGQEWDDGGRDLAVTRAAQNRC
jgi:hypothetical protein